MQKRLSIKAIAKDLNISPTTISFVLNDKALDKRISPAVIDRVRKHIEKIGYQPNSMAQCLRTGRSKMIVFMVEDISNPFFAAVARIIEKRLFQEGYTTIYCSTDNGLDRTRRLIRQFNDLSVDGYIIGPPAGFNTSELEQLIQDGKSVVFFQGQLSDLAYRYGETERHLYLSGSTYPQEELANEFVQVMLHLLATGDPTKNQKAKVHALSHGGQHC